MKKGGVGGKRAKATAAAALGGLLGALVVTVHATLAQMVGESGSRMDLMMTRLRRVESAPGFDYSRLSAAGRKLFNLADRWTVLRSRAPSGYVGALGTVKRLGAATNVRASRYSGFTQSETSTAWCGPNAVIGFNDTGAEVTTITAGRGVSIDG